MKIFDLHNDMLTGLKGGRKTQDRDIEAIYAIWTTELTVKRAASIARKYKDGRMLAVEDCGIFKDDFSFFLEFDFKYVGLTWNSCNGLAGGAFSHDALLSARGEALIDLLNERNVPVDTAHLNRESFFKVADRANKIICSHTCFEEVNIHCRNLTRRQISVIIEKGGIVGLCLVCDFLGGNDIRSVIRHIDWFLDAFGDKNLAIGTDFYGTNNLPSDLRSYKALNDLALAMKKHGYTDSTIDAIFYSNAAEYFSDRR